MKNILSILIAIALLSGTASVKAAVTVGTITNYSKLTIAWVLTTNKAQVTTGNTTKTATGSAKISNSTLLAMFASWSNNNLSDWTTAGAQLVFDWDNYEVDVADKTGTNILFFAGGGVTNSTVRAYFYVDFLYFPGPFNETDNNANGSSSWTQEYSGNMELYFNDSSNANNDFDFFSDGPNAEKFSFSGTANTWSDTEKFTVSNCQVTLPTTDPNYFAIITGTISATGKGPGDNPAIY